MLSFGFPSSQSLQSCSPGLLSCFAYGNKANSIPGPPFPSFYGHCNLISRENFTDLNLKNGVTIPAGAGLVVPVQLVQMDGSSWGSHASEFNPYRFLSKPGAGSESDIMPNNSVSGASGKVVNPGENSSILKDPNGNTAFLPFGSGIRACMGKKFVIKGVATLFASLLEHYQIKLQLEAQYNQEPNNVMFQPCSGSQIVFIKRGI